MKMTQRENMLRALRRDEPESVPFDFELYPSQKERFKERFGTENYREYFDFPMRYIEPRPSRHLNDYNRYYRDIEGPIEPLE